MARLPRIDFPGALYHVIARGNGRADTKHIALEPACRLTGWTQRAIGAHYGGISSGAVCMARHKLRDQGDAVEDTLQRLLKRLARESQEDDRRHT